MSQRSLFILILLVLAGMATILIININSLFSSSRHETYLSYNDVKGMEIEHNRLFYTLNFDQQNQVITAINRAVPIGSAGIKLDPNLNFARLIIYRFNAPNLVLMPIRYVKDELIYRIPRLKEDGYFKDISQGSLKKLISESYDNS